MKTKLPYQFLLIAIISLAQPVLAQRTVTSTTGYTVDINVQPESIIAPNSCQYGYSYKVRLTYLVTFSGKNIPNNLYTLQGNIGCGNNQQFFSLPKNGGSGAVNSAQSWSSQQSCQTASPAVLECNTISIQIQGPGINNQTVSYPITYGTLPVKLVSFDAITIGKLVKLNWVTAAETNNDHFNVQRSADGLNWSDIQEIKGAGNSSSREEYEAFDNSPLQGTSYYRLKQVDIDGKPIYTENVMVKTAIASTASISVFPVPSNGSSVTVSGIQDINNYSLEIIDRNGTVKSQQTNLTHNQINLPGLSAGIYVLRFTNKENQQQQSVRYIQL